MADNQNAVATLIAKEADERWRFSKRVVTYDMRERRPLKESELFAIPASDASFDVLKDRLFARGARA
jgi:hypothetical protein